MDATDTVRDELDYRQLVVDVLTRFGATRATIQAAPREIDDLAAAIRDAEPGGNELSDRRPSDARQVVAAQAHTAASQAVARELGVSPRQRPHLFALVAINLHLAAALAGETREAYRIYGYWSRLLPVDGPATALWDGLFAWQWPAWKAHLLRQADSEPTFAALRATVTPVVSVRWLVDRIVEEGALHGVTVGLEMAAWLAGPDEDPRGVLARRRLRSRFDLGVALTQHASRRSALEHLPRGVWDPDRGPYPSAAWCGHWDNAWAASRRSWAAHVVAHAHNTLTRLGPRRPRGATRQPRPGLVHLDRHFQ